MKQHAPFSQQLKYERERRGWSQADVAEKVGCDSKSLGRWESGKLLPRPMYKQALCDLFGKSMEEFGLANHVEPSIEEDVQEQKEDWGEAPRNPLLYGRVTERAEILHLLLQHCQVLALLGIGGVGKTSLASSIAGQVKHEFDFVFWRSLQNAPSLEHVLAQCISFISDEQHALPDTIDAQLTLLISLLQSRRCLFILDNVESVLQSGQSVGQYQEGYESYGRLLRRLGETPHQSCLLLTSREKPREITSMEGNSSRVRSFHLLGVKPTEGQELLQERGLFGSPEQWQHLVQLYTGNPLALKLASASIEMFYAGDIAHFLQAENLAIDDISYELDQQFQRLSPVEREIVYWLAVEREAVSLETLRENVIRPTLQGELMTSLNSLLRRFLVEPREKSRFTLQPVIMEYATNELVRRACTGFSRGLESVWTSHAFLKAQARDYIRKTQQRLILDPIAQQLLVTFGKEGIEQQVQYLLEMQRRVSPIVPGYLAGNILNLLIWLHCDISHFDFSALPIYQAYLQDVALPDVLFASASFSRTLFTNTFGSIFSLSFAPHASLLAAGASNGDIWLYQLQSGEMTCVLTGHTDATWSVAFSPDGSQLASASDDLTIRLWDLATGTCSRVLRGHTNRVRSLAFSNDGQRLVSASEDFTLRLWDVATGEAQEVLEGHTDRVWSVGFHPSGELLASGSTDGTIRLWDLATHQCLRILDEHTGWVRAISFHPAGALLASSSDDRTVRLWNVDTGACLRVLSGHTNRVWTVTFAKRGSIVVSGSEDSTIRLWDSESGRCLNVLSAHANGVRAVAADTRTSMFASGGEDQGIRLWEGETGECLKTLQGYTNRVWSADISPDGHLLASSSEDRCIRLWDLKSERCSKTFQDRTHGARMVIFSPSGSLLASCGEDQNARLWDVATGTCRQILKGHTTWVRAMAFRYDGLLLATGGEDGTIYIWDMQHLEEASYHRILAGHQSWIRSVTFSPSGSLLASGSDDQKVLLWDVNSGQCLHAFAGHTGRVRAVAFSPTGSLLASASEDKTVRLWNVATRTLQTTLAGHSSRVMALAFSPCGTFLASGSDDQTIRLWQKEADGATLVATLAGHAGRIRSLVFSPDSTLLISASDDGSIKLWNVQERACLTTLTNERPYERMNITHARGLSTAQKASLLALGAHEEEE